METKQKIRKEVYAKRKAYATEEIHTMSLQAQKQVLATEPFQKADRLLIYADYKHEVETGMLIETALKLGKEIALPKVNGKEMDFYQVTSTEVLKPGYCGIPEPETGEIICWEDACMIMPGVAFDERGHRVGYGGGYYDRYLEKHPDIIKIALAFEFQIYEEVPVEETDICPELIVTEKRLIWGK